jgi:hypothetical protein
MENILAHEKFSTIKKPWGFYVNCGDEDMTDEFNIAEFITPTAMAQFI